MINETSLGDSQTVIHLYIHGRFDKLCDSSDSFGFDGVSFTASRNESLSKPSAHCPYSQWCDQVKKSLCFTRLEPLLDL